MYLELIFFILVVLCGLAVCITNSKQLFIIVYIPLTVIFIIIMRLSYLNNDMKVYADLMKGSSWILFFLREFAFYGLLRGAFFIFKNVELSLIFLDFLWMLILGIALKKRYPKNWYILFVILFSSFPFLLGYENVYRQFWAIIILLAGYFIRKENQVISTILGILSIFFHNSMVIFASVYILDNFFNLNLKWRRRLHDFYAVFSIWLIVNLREDIDRAAVSTGLDLTRIYFIIFLGFFILYNYKYFLRLGYIIKNFPIVYSAVFTSTILIFVSSVIGSAGTERLMLTYFVLILCQFFEKSEILDLFKRRNLYLLLNLGYSLPVFIFPSALTKLINTG